MTETKTESVTRLLIERSRGNRNVADGLLPFIYNELRSPAASYLRRERPDHTLQPTALVHEAYLRLVDQRSVNWQRLARKKSRVVELRYFGGLSVEETAEVLGLSPTTVKRHWRMAKAWLS